MKRRRTGLVIWTVAILALAAVALAGRLLEDTSSGIWFGINLASSGPWIALALSALGPWIVDDAVSRWRQRRSAIELLPRDRTHSGNVSDLLDPNAEVIGFVGRRAELAGLQNWASVRGDPVRVVAGPGGTGKTRLLLELSKRLKTSGWDCRFPDEPDVADVIERYRAVSSGPLLLVIDYAESRVGLRALLSKTTDAPDQTKVVLLARSAGDWLDVVRNECPRDVRAQLASPELVLELRNSLGDIRSQAEFLEAAAQQIATAVDLRPPITAIHPDLLDPSPLELCVAAILDVLGQPQNSQEAPTGIAAVAPTQLNALLDHERRYWRITSTSHGLAVSSRTLDQLVGAIALFGADDDSSAVMLISRLFPEVDTKRAVAWLKKLGSGRDGAGLFNLRPHRLAERLVTTVLSSDPSFESRAFSDMSPLQARNAILMLSRAAADGEDVVATMNAYIPAALGPICDGPQPVEALAAIGLAIPLSSPDLAQVHETVVRRALEEMRNTASPNEYATWLSFHAACLLQLGMPHASVDEFRLALATLRNDVGDEKDDLEIGRVLCNLSTALLKDGAAGAAVDAATEAVAIIHGARTDASERDRALGWALLMQSNALAAADRDDDALACTLEAVALFRALVNDSDPESRNNLAQALSNLGNRHSNLGDFADAAEVALEAVTIHRELAAFDPRTFRAPLAKTLGNLALILDSLGPTAEGLAMLRQSTEIYEALFSKLPSAFRADYAKALVNLAAAEAGSGDSRAAASLYMKGLALNRELPTNRQIANAARASIKLAGLLALIDRRDESIELWSEIGTTLLAELRSPEVLPTSALQSLIDLLGEYHRAGLTSRVDALLTEMTAILEARVPRADPAELILRAQVEAWRASLWKVGSQGREEDHLRAALLLLDQAQSMRQSTRLAAAAAIRRADAALKLGRLLRQAGETAAAAGFADVVFASLAAIHRDGPNEASLLSSALVLRSGVRSDQGDKRLSLEDARAAVSAVDRPKFGLNDDLEVQLAFALLNLGVRLSLVGKERRSIACGLRARELLLKHRDDEDARLALTATLHNLGVSYSKVHRRRKRVAVETEAFLLHEQTLASGLGTDINAFEETTNALLDELGHKGESVQALALLDRFQAALGTCDPVDREAAHTRASALVDLATKRANLGDLKRAVADLREAARIYRVLLDPESGDGLSELTSAFILAARMLAEQGLPAEAVLVLEECVDVLEQAPPTEGALRSEMSALSGLAHLRMDLGLGAEAVGSATKALDLLATTAIDDGDMAIWGIIELVPLISVLASHPEVPQAVALSQRIERDLRGRGVEFA